MTPTNIFKDFEFENLMTVPKDSYAILRLDGRAFHTFTKDPILNFKRPYDQQFINAMNDGAKRVVTDVIPSALLTYVASDEVSILFKADELTPFKRSMNKLLTLAVSAMTIGFNTSLSTDKALFDGRFAYIGGPEELKAYFDWRRLDAWKNMISNASYELYPVSELQGKSTKDRLQMLEGTIYEKMDDSAVWGRYLTKERYVTYSPTSNQNSIERTRFEFKPAIRKTSDELIQDILDTDTKTKEFEAFLDTL